MDQFSYGTPLDKKVLTDATQHDDQNLMYARERRPAGSFKKDYNGLLNERYMRREDSFREMIDRRCATTSNAGHRCKRDRIRLGQEFADIKTLEFETPSGYLNSKDIEKSIYGNLSNIGWGKCPQNPGDEACVRNTSTSRLADTMGSTCQKTSMSELKDGSSSYAGTTPETCEATVGNLSSYFRLANPSEYSRMLANTLRKLEAEEQFNLS